MVNTEFKVIKFPKILFFDFVAIKLLLETITSEKLSAAIQEVINDPKYRIEAK